MTEENQKDAILQSTPEDIEKNKTMAILAYFLFFLPLLTDAKDSPFAKFHANQSFLLTIGYFVSMLISSTIVGALIGIPLSIALFILWVIGILNASKGEMKELPVIGGIHILDK